MSGHRLEKCFIKAKSIYHFMVNWIVFWFLPDVLSSRLVTVKFVQDTSKFWYKPDISRDQGMPLTP